jgi:hypothetical protein
LHAPDHVFEQLLFAPQLLGPLRLVPDLRVLELFADLRESIDFYIDVKDTSAVRSSAS